MVLSQSRIAAGVEEVRGRGLMLGVSLGEGLDAAEIASRAVDAGLIVNVPVPSTLRLLPPLIVGEAEIDDAASVLSDVIK
jgi:acetylornithine/N-succinyldiaminopimelate aminotransferase